MPGAQELKGSVVLVTGAARNIDRATIILEGAFLWARFALPRLRRSDGASIVNIGGMTGRAVGRVHGVAGKAGPVGSLRRSPASWASR